MWIKEVPTLSLKQKLSKSIFPNKLRKTVIETSFGSINAYIFNDGFIFINSENKDEALRIINTIATAMFIKNFKSYACREIDLIKAVYNAKERLFSRMEGEILASQRVNKIFDFNWIRRRIDYAKTGLENIITIDNFTDVIKLAKTIYQDEGLNTLGIALLEGLTYLDLRYYREAFITTWTVLEYYINILWEEYLNSSNMKLSKNRRKN